jgi:TerC family integral membrane protein
VESEILLFVLFNIFILILLAIDLGLFHKEAHAIGLREATFWSILWIVVALIFNAGIFLVAGSTKGVEFLTGYVIERALSFDNIFVFVVIFSYFGVPRAYQYKALIWGVLGALVTRLLFIIAGTALIAQFEWVLYVFGLILILSGWKIMVQKGTEVHPERNIFIRLARKLFPVVTGYDSPRFFLRIDGKIFMTPLFLVLVTIETTDIMFAVDSIPAVFGVTRDPFIVYSSNVFAILGLRATYFLLAGVMETFYYLSYGLSAILIFIGAKMLFEHLYPLPTLVSLGVVMVILTLAIIASLLRNRRVARKKGME